MMRFCDQVALITGAGRGIGRAIALRLAAEGAAIAALDRDFAVVEALVATLQSDGGRALALRADITDAAAVAQAVETVPAWLGRIDVLINNAAAVSSAALAGTTPASWDRDLTGTLTGAFLVTRAVLPVMERQRRGSIVNIGSINGLIALGNPAYSAAKAGLLSYTKALAVEYGPKGIRANMVSPGTVRTEHPSWQARQAREPAIFDKLARWYPVGRVGRPEDIAAAVAFLAAEEAGFVNGANLVVDGGLTAGIMPMIAELAIEDD